MLKPVCECLALFFLHNMQRKLQLIFDRWERHSPGIFLWTSSPFLSSQFITGDNPVVTFCNTAKQPQIQSLLPPAPEIVNLRESLESSNSGFCVPLSPYIALTVLNSGARNGITVVPSQSVDPRVVGQFNAMIYGQCVNFVAARDPEYLAFHVKQEKPNRI